MSANALQEAVIAPTGALTIHLQELLQYKHLYECFILDIAYLAVGDSIVDAHRDELFSNDLRQLSSLKQALHLAGGVGKHRLNAVGLQVSHPLLPSRSNQ